MTPLEEMIAMDLAQEAYSLEKLARVEQGMEDKPDLSFSLRFAFLRWLNSFLEGTFHAATKRLGKPASKKYDLQQWNRAISVGAVDIEAAYTCSDVTEVAYTRLGAEQMRHDFVHRQNSSVKQLRYALKLPSLLGDNVRDQELTRVLALFRKAYERDADEKSVDAFFNAVVVAPLPAYMQCYNSKASLFGSLQNLIEKALFRDTEKHDVAFLRYFGWTVVEQCEIPEWETYHRCRETCHRSRQLWSCLRNARSLRNVAEHRDETGTGLEALTHVRNTVTTLTKLGDFEGALEAEILGEQWFTKKSRAQVLARRATTLDKETGDSTGDPLLCMRRLKRREALIKALSKTTAHPTPATPPGKIHIDNAQNLLNVCYNIEEKRPSNLSCRALKAIEMSRSGEWGYSSFEQLYAMLPREVVVKEEVVEKEFVW